MVTRYTSVFMCFHLSEWRNLRILMLTRDYHDDDNNHDDIFFVSEPLDLFMRI